MRNGSYTSSTVSGCSPTLMASVDSPTGPPPNCWQIAREDGPVDLVEPALVDAEQRQAVAGRRRRSIVPSPRTSAKSRTRRSSRLAMRGVPRLRRAISARAVARRSSTPRMPAARVTMASSSSAS